MYPRWKAPCHSCYKPPRSVRPPSPPPTVNLLRTPWLSACAGLSLPDRIFKLCVCVNPLDGRILAEPRHLPLGISAGIHPDIFHRLAQGQLPVQVIEQLG